jgi:hypothetical protein
MLGHNKGQRKLCNEKIYNLNSSSKIVMLIFKKSEIRGACMKHVKNYEVVQIWSESQGEQRKSENKTWTKGLADIKREFREIFRRRRLAWNSAQR